MFTGLPLVRRIATTSVVLVCLARAASAQQTEQTYEPEVGQPGKDVVWVPTPFELVERMLDLANVTPQDFVMDLGSGDGRNVIAAAKRGARALGVEFNPDMVALSKRNAAAAGVTDKATFVQGDMFQADISQASVMALFLLPSHMNTLRPKFLDLRPGSRIVSNTFGVDGWFPDDTATLQPCDQWCTAYLWIVPAKVVGTWRLPEGDLVLKQENQMVTGTLGADAIVGGKLRGEEIRFTAGGREFIGRVSGDQIEGTVRGVGSETPWTAKRVN